MVHEEWLVNWDGSTEPDPFQNLTVNGESIRFDPYRPGSYFPIMMGWLCYDVARYYGYRGWVLGGDPFVPK